jgi:mRNA-degrading endonuclease toxin of MazEF toxin-antitoxin module
VVDGVPQQGDIIKLDLNPRKGHEQQGFRPVIVLSNNRVVQKLQFMNNFLVKKQNIGL